MTKLKEHTNLQLRFLGTEKEGSRPTLVKFAYPLQFYGVTING